MDKYKIPKEYEDCAKRIEKKTGKHLSNYLSQALLREVTENTKTESPLIYTSKFMNELKGKSVYFIKEVVKLMVVEAEMNSELKG